MGAAGGVPNLGPVPRKAMLRALTWCWRCSEDAEEMHHHEQGPPSPTTRPLLRLTWGRNSPADVKRQPAQLECGLCFRFAGGRYTLCSEIGHGAHCVVWRCLRVSKDGHPRAFALKVHTEEGAAFKRESAALERLREVGRRGALFPHVLGKVRVGCRHGLAMALYGPDLYVLQKQRQRRPFPPPFVWAVAEQLALALEVLASAELVHADIKPQNVVQHGGAGATLDRDSRIVLIDLGSCLSKEQLSSNVRRITYVQSRWYRSPEVLLWSSISFAADAWSVGCVLAEVALGVPLLPGESEFNQVRRIDMLLGAPPMALLERCRRAERFFVLPTLSAERSSACANVPLLRRGLASSEPALIRYLPDADLGGLVHDYLCYQSRHERDALVTILEGLLRWDPNDRWASGRLHTEIRLLEPAGLRSSEVKSGSVPQHPWGFPATAECCAAGSP